MTHSNEKKKFLVLATQRSGSVFLEKYLHSHPQVGCFGEVLLGMGSPHTPWIPEWLMQYRRPRLAWYYVLSGAMTNPTRAVRAVYSQDYELVGFRGMYDQLHSRRNRGVLKSLASDTSISIIHLMRQNVLKQYVSRYIMRRHRRLGRGRAHTTKELKPVSVEIPPALAEREVKKLLMQRNSLRESFKDHRMIELQYETMIDNNQISTESIDSICDVLQVSNQFEEPPLKKMNPTSLASMLTNYDQWESYFANTEFAELL